MTTWNDTDIPLAFLITFRSYGTWLHGDERGSVNRFRNQYKTRRLPPEGKWVETNTQRLKGDIVVLDATQRDCVSRAILETCELRRWTLHAMNVRPTTCTVWWRSEPRNLRQRSTHSRQMR